MKKLNIFISALVAGIISTSPANAKIPFLSKSQTKNAQPANYVEAKSSTTDIVYHQISPVTGKILEVLVKIGDTVKPGDICIVVEVMDMAMELAVERAGKVSEIRVKVGDTVEPQEVLFVLRQYQVA